MITGIHHFSIIASSEASVEFYKKLNFHENRRIKRAYDTVVLMEGLGIGLEIFIDPRHYRQKEVTLGFRTLSLKADDLDEIDGIIISDWNGERYINTTDPDGNMIQIHE